MTSQMSSEILQKSTRGALWGHIGPKEAQEGGPAPPGDPKRRSRSPPGHHFYHFWDLFWMFSNIIHDLLSTTLYAELCLHQYPTTKNERIRRNNFHDFVAVQLMVRRTISRPTITWTAIKSWKIHTLMAVGREIVRPTIGCDGGGSGNVAVWPMVGRTISRPTSMKVCIFHNFVAV